MTTKKKTMRSFRSYEALDKAITKYALSKGFSSESNAIRHIIQTLLNVKPNNR